MDSAPSKPVLGHPQVGRIGWEWWLDNVKFAIDQVAFPRLSKELLYWGKVILVEDSLTSLFQGSFNHVIIAVLLTFSS